MRRGTGLQSSRSMFKSVRAFVTSMYSSSPKTHDTRHEVMMIVTNSVTHTTSSVAVDGKSVTLVPDAQDCHSAVAEGVRGVARRIEPTFSDVGGPAAIVTGEELAKLISVSCVDDGPMRVGVTYGSVRLTETVESAEAIGRILKYGMTRLVPLPGRTILKGVYPSRCAEQYVDRDIFRTRRRIEQTDPGAMSAWQNRCSLHVHLYAFSDTGVEDCVCMRWQEQRRGVPCLDHDRSIIRQGSGDVLK